MILFVLVIITLLVAVDYYEKFYLFAHRQTKAVPEKTVKNEIHNNEPSKAEVPCPCVKAEPKINARPRDNSRRKQPPKQKPVETAQAPVREKQVSPTTNPEQKKVLASQDALVPDFYDKAVFPKNWKIEEEEVVPEPPPKVGRKIYVVRQPSPQPQYFYGGGYGYSTGGTPQVISGGTPTFVPNPPVIVPAPSVVVPAGGHPPGYNTKGVSPGYTTL